MFWMYSDKYNSCITHVGPGDMHKIAVNSNMLNWAIGSESEEKKW